MVRAAAGDRVRIEVNSERLGLAGNWNRCAALARTPFVAIFHQDDVMMPGHLAGPRGGVYVRRFPGPGRQRGRRDRRAGRASLPKRWSNEGDWVPSTGVYDPGELAVAMAAGNPLRCSAVTIRVAAFAELGGFDPSYRYVVDWDFWLRVSRRWKVAWLARPTVQIRWHPTSETHRFRAGTADLDETARLLEQLFALDLKDRPESPQLRAAANARLGRAFLNRAHDALHAGRSELARDALRARPEALAGA